MDMSVKMTVGVEIRSQAFSTTPLFEVKILWTESDTFFHCALSKIIISPKRISFLSSWWRNSWGRACVNVCVQVCVCVDWYSPPDGIASEHPRAGQPHTHQISNQIQIHEGKPLAAQSLSLCVCVCMCVCVRKESGKERERDDNLHVQHVHIRQSEKEACCWGRNQRWVF